MENQSSVSPKITQTKRDEITRKITAMCAIVFLSLSVVNGAGFKEFCEAINSSYKEPCRKTTMIHVLKLYEDTKLHLVGSLSQVAGVALTTDMWTSVADDEYITVTAYYLTTNYILATRSLRGTLARTLPMN